MNNSNPYIPIQTLAESESKVTAKPKTGERGSEIFHNAFRGLLAFLFLGFVPVFILPKFKVLFEEFEAELPTLAQLVLQFGDLAAVVPIAFLPLSFGLFAAIECGIFTIPTSPLKTLINIVYWLALILVIGSASFTFLNIFNQISSSLASTVDPFVAISSLTNL